MGEVRWGWVWVCIVAAVLVRAPAATTLPMDADEPIYLQASQEAAGAIQRRDWAGLANPSINPEHPGLVKTLYGLMLSRHPEGENLVVGLITVRSLSLVAGVAVVGVAAAVHPIAGVALATHTLHAKYSSQGYLDSLPVLWMGLAMILGWRWRHSTEERRWWLLGSLWGAALAGKWLHGVPGLVLVLTLSSRRAKVHLCLAGILSWVVLDPSMWSGPIGSITEQLAHHERYARSLTTTTPWYAPLWHLSAGEGARWHPEVFPLSLDPLWSLAAAAGLLRGWRSPYQRFLVGWILLPLLVLIGWSTRWPQHAMVLVLPVALAAATVLRRTTGSAQAEGESPP